MGRKTYKTAIFFALALVVFQAQPMQASSASCEIFEGQESGQSVPIIFSDTLYETLKKIKQNVYVPNISLHHIRNTSLDELQHVNARILPNDNLFDSWIDLILELSLLNTKDFNFRRSLELAEEKGGRDAATAHAHCNLGSMYKHGYGVEQNFAKAMAYYQQAADQGRADACNNIGYMYRRGQGVGQDLVKALQYYQKAIDQGSLCALTNLGYMYRYGCGVEKDLSKAFQYYQKAANFGYMSAFRILGDMYCQEQGVKKDFVKAIQYFKKAADQGNSCALKSLGDMHEHGQGTRQDLTQALKYYLESFKFKIVNSTYEDDLKKSLRNLVTFVPSTITHRDKAQISVCQKTLENDIDYLLMLHGLEEGINKSNSWSIERKVALPDVFEAYQKITCYGQDLYDVIKALPQTGFMVSCLHPKDKHLFKSSMCLDIQYCDFLGKPYLTFGKDNVEVAKKLITILSDAVSSCNQAISDILEILKNILANYENVTELSDNAKALKQQYIARLQLQSGNNSLNINNIPDDHKKLIKMVMKQKISLEELQIIPQRLQELVQDSRSYRNKLFLKQNPYILSIFKDF